ncbi:ATR-interacting protein isoform X2 [Brienomyrus brachyistius]|uniref:ATR-interacting protein isoform X2 n=1 Tax=Brienomyrus brachyistius TaxID=42636 RepID=UPI0020B1B615|nr:ATR-interacting protein isoform X2 [Brienomyrus brachyistius]
MEYPPNKRLKGESYDARPDADPFGDDEDFTQDDLDEIDIIASQAVTDDLAPPAPKESRGSVFPCQGPLRKAGLEARRTFGSAGVSGDVRRTSGSNLNNTTMEAFRKGQQQNKADRCEVICEQLQAQQAELKKKLQEVEEELLMKTGEIQVLRDSLRQTKQEKEQQREAQLLQEQERAQVQTEKEKALSKKLQCLQSELHFKEVEINEMKTRLVNSERAKLPVSPATRNSPKSRSSLPHPQEGSGPSASVSRFLTKEAFAAQLPKGRSPLKEHAKEDGKPVNETVNNIAGDAHRGKSSSLHSCHSQGSSLLNLLLQHPLDPSTLGLCHLLCVSPGALPWLLSQNDSLSPEGSSCTLMEAKQQHGSLGSFGRIQSLGMCGLSRLALGYPRLPPQPPVSERSCPEALHLLPLLQQHVDLFCRALEAVDGPAGTLLRDASPPDSASAGGLTSGAEESASSLEEFALASLGALRHLVSHSEEVVHVLLSSQAQECTDKRDVERGAPGPAFPEPSGGNRGEGAELLHPLLRWLLRLADPVVAGAARRGDVVLTSSLKVLNALAEDSGGELLPMMKSLLCRQSLARCLSADASSQTAHLSVSLLAAAAANTEVAVLLCSHVDVCPLLKIFQYVASRPNVSMSENQWCRFELEVVKLLTRLFTQATATWIAFTRSSCQCDSECVVARWCAPW